jgi:endoglucanase
LIDDLKILSEIFGPSGKEERVKEFIFESLRDYVDEIFDDYFGNLYVRKGNGNPKVLICSHMDEVGFIVKGITHDGYLKFEPIGSIEPEVCIGKKIIFENGRKGVIGFKPFHLQKEKDKKIDFEELVIDVGMSKKEAEKKFFKGIYATFSTPFSSLNNDFFKGKAFDDRVGCCILIEIMKNFSPDYELVALFSSQEEVGLRGAKIGAEKILPHIGVVVETTAAGDFYKKDEEDFPSLSKGPVLTIIDRACIVNREIFEIIKKIAEKENIPFQYKKPLIGGTDAGNIQIAGKGVKIAVISVPSRYIHSPVSIINKIDLENTYSLLLNFLKEVKNYG